MGGAPGGRPGSSLCPACPSSVPSPTRAWAPLSRSGPHSGPCRCSRRPRARGAGEGPRAPDIHNERPKSDLSRLRGPQEQSRGPYKGALGGGKSKGQGGECVDTGSRASPAGEATMAGALQKSDLRFGRRDTEARPASADRERSQESVALRGRRRSRDNLPGPGGWQAGGAERDLHSQSRAAGRAGKNTGLWLTFHFKPRVSNLQCKYVRSTINLTFKQNGALCIFSANLVQNHLLEMQVCLRKPRLSYLKSAWELWGRQPGQQGQQGQQGWAGLTGWTGRREPLCLQTLSLAGRGRDESDSLASDKDWPVGIGLCLQESADPRAVGHVRGWGPRIQEEPRGLLRAKTWLEAVGEELESPDEERLSRLQADT